MKYLKYCEATFEPTMQKIRTNDRSIMRRLSDICLANGVKYIITDESDLFPPTFWAKCNERWFNRIMLTYFGITMIHLKDEVKNYR